MNIFLGVVIAVSLVSIVMSIHEHGNFTTSFFFISPWQSKKLRLDYSRRPWFIAPYNAWLRLHCVLLITAAHTSLNFFQSNWSQNIINLSQKWLVRSSLAHCLSNTRNWPQKKEGKFADNKRNAAFDNKTLVASFETFQSQIASRVRNNGSSCQQ